MKHVRKAPYAKGLSSKSNLSGESESSAGSFLSRTRYWKRDRNVHQLFHLRQKQARPLPSAVTHHVEVQSFAEVDRLQQQHQPALHLLGFEQQAVEGLGGATLTQEVQDGEESHVLLGQMIVCQQTFCT